MGDPQPRPVSAEVAGLGEGARWDAERGELLWVDINAGVLRRAVEDGAGLRTLAAVGLGEPLGAATTVHPGSGGGWLLAAGRGPGVRGGRRRRRRAAAAAVPGPAAEPGRRLGVRPGR